MRMHTPNQKQYYTISFQKSKQNKMMGDVFCWIFGHVSLLKLEKYVENENC